MPGATGDLGQELLLLRWFFCLSFGFFCSSSGSEGGVGPSFSDLQYLRLYQPLRIVANTSDPSVENCFLRSDLILIRSSRTVQHGTSAQY